MFRNRTLKTKISIILILVYLLSILNIFYPVLRFENRSYNLWYTIAFMMVPFMLYTLGFGYKHWYTKMIGTVLYGSIALFSGIVIVFVLYGLAHMTDDCYDPSFKVLDSHYYDDSRVVIYEVNGGAISSFGTKVRQEKKFIAVLLFVRDIFVLRGDKDIEIEFERDFVVIDEEEYEIKDNIFF